MTWGDSRPPVSEAGQNSAAVPWIPQAMLEELISEKAHAQNYERLRELILQRLEEGAAVEGGRLEVGVEKSWQQRLTDAALTAALGATKVAELKAGAAPTVFRRLIVTGQSRQAES